jgi:hypothetical protein
MLDENKYKSSIIWYKIGMQQMYAKFWGKNKLKTVKKYKQLKIRKLTKHFKALKMKKVRFIISSSFRAKTQNLECFFFHANNIFNFCVEN